MKKKIIWAYAIFCIIWTAYYLNLGGGEALILPTILTTILTLPIGALCWLFGPAIPWPLFVPLQLILNVFQWVLFVSLYKKWKAKRINLQPRLFLNFQNFWKKRPINGRLLPKNSRNLDDFASFGCSGLRPWSQTIDIGGSKMSFLACPWYGHLRPRQRLLNYETTYKNIQKVPREIKNNRS